MNNYRVTIVINNPCLKEIVCEADADTAEVAIAKATLYVDGILDKRYEYVIQMIEVQTVEGS